MAKFLVQLYFELDDKTSEKMKKEMQENIDDYKKELKDIEGVIESDVQIIEL